MPYSGHVKRIEENLFLFMAAAIRGTGIAHFGLCILSEYCIP